MPIVRRLERLHAIAVMDDAAAPHDMGAVADRQRQCGELLVEDGVVEQRAVAGREL